MGFRQVQELVCRCVHVCGTAPFVVELTVLAQSVAEVTAISTNHISDFMGTLCAGT
jgi:hypothetical protein